MKQFSYIGSTALLASLLAMPALAVTPPGSPPWHCMGMSVCNSGDACYRLPSQLIVFSVSELEGSENQYVFETMDPDLPYVAQEYASLEAARTDANNQTMPREVGLVFLRTQQASDAHSFDIHEVERRSKAGVTTWSVSDISMSLVCL